MAFNGSGTVSGSATAGSGNAGGGGGGSGSGTSTDGPLNKRLCTGKENNEAGLNNNRVSNQTIYTHTLHKREKHVHLNSRKCAITS